MEKQNKMDVEHELVRLKAENRRLRQILKDHGIFVPEEGVRLTGEQKIAIYMDYFHGRTDIFNKYYWSRKRNCFSWSVSCSHFWQEGCRIKKGEKDQDLCFTCPAAAFDKLTPDMLRHLFRGDRHSQFYGIGIFPLLDDNTCFFLAIDFDDDHWFSNMLTVYKTAVSFEMYPVMERSQSGHGGHLWFFFASNVKASDARKFGKLILQKAMGHDGNISFSSFDRMIPNQDYAPEKGHGNCIALPLRGDAYVKGNSAFINMMGQVIRPPIEYLLSRPKITIEELGAFINENTIADYFFDNDQMQMNLQTDIKYPETINGYIHGHIAIEKRNLNAISLNIIRRCASMWNPEYFKRLREKKTIYYKSTPCVLQFDEEDDKYIYIPGGLLDKLNSCFPETQFKLEERFTNGENIDVSFIGKLRPKQETAVKAMIYHRNGILRAVPSFGKTVCAIWLIAYFHVNTLIIMDSTELQDQWEQRLNTFLGYPLPEKKRDKFIRQFNGSHKKLGGKIDIATADSLIHLPDMNEVLSSYGLVIVDECHHAATPTYRHILSLCSSAHIYGLTADPSRSDGLGKVVYMYLGPVRYHETEVSAQMDYDFRQILVPRYTAARMLKDSYSYPEMMEELEKDQARNWLIYRDIVKEYRENGKILVLSERVNQLKTIADMLRKTCEEVYLLTGSVKKKERKEIIDHVRMLKTDSRYILLATSTLLGEGFDLPSLKTMFLLLPITSSSRVEQYTGRIHRNYEGKDEVKVYDYVDIEIPMAAAMYHKRLAQYQKEGYFVLEAKQEVDVNQYFFEGMQGRTSVRNDILNAAGEIVVFSASPSLAYIQQEYQNLEKPLRNGRKVYAILPSSMKDQKAAIYIKGMGATLKFNEHNRNFVLIDRRMVWISSHDFLEDEDGNGWYIREDNPAMAEELLHALNDKKEIPVEEGIFQTEDDISKGN